MIAKIISKKVSGRHHFGSRPAGLMSYLLGPGIANEHQNQHVVVASKDFALTFEGRESDVDAALEMGHFIDGPAKQFGVEVKTGHVRHFVLSLSPEETTERGGPLSDAMWSDIVTEYLDSMGYTGANGEAHVRYAAVRHGLTKAEGDHIHIVATLVRVDGSLVNTKNDFYRSREAATRIEERHGLRVTGQEFSTRDYHRGELESLARRRAMGKYTQEAKLDPSRVPWGMLDQAARDHLISEQMKIEQPRFDLSLKVRAAGAGARSESEYVRRLRGNGLLVRPYFAKGGTEQVSGYSVALRPVHGERPIWYGGGTLAKDLTLPALRAGWPDTSRSDAVSEWQAAAAGRRFATADPQAVSPAQNREYFSQLSGYLRTISEANVNDPAEYAAIAREGAGLFAAWAVAAGAEGDENAKALADASRLFARHAELSDRPVRAVRASSTVFADLCTYQAISMSTRAGAVAVIRAWANLGKALGQAFATKGWAQRSEVLSTELRAQLNSVHDAYRVINPLPAKTTTAVADRPTVATVKKSQTVDREAQLAALEERLRAAGAPEKAIAARMFAERQDKFGGGRSAPKKEKSTIKHSRTEPPRKDRGPEKGMNR